MSCCCIYESLFVLAGALFCLYLWLTWNYNYWSNKNVKGPRPIPLFGNFREHYLRKAAQGQQLKKLYDEFPDEPFVGIYERRTPALILKSPDLIRDIMIKDFSSFADRSTFPIYEKSQPLSAHLFNLESTRWRPLRTKMTPLFTSGKLKEMFYLILECADHLEPHVDELMKKNNNIIEVNDLMAKYSIDVIGECAFGLKSNAIAEENSVFSKISKTIVNQSPWVFYLYLIKEAAPWLAGLLNKMFSQKRVGTMTNFFLNMMAQNFKYRKETGIRRNDFIDLMMDLQADPSKVNDMELTLEMLTAQAFVFFVAGFDTSTNMMSHALYEMALNPNIQDKLRAEITEELAKNDGKLTYESVKDMKYLHKVFCETLRKRSSGQTLTRRVTKDYKFNNTNLTVPKGLKIYIPIQAIHLDPKNYPDPDVFDPERFSEENIAKRHPSVYLPFGDGPRNCIGMRFGQYQSKVGLITILKNYRVEVCEKTDIPLTVAPTILLVATKNGIHLKFEKIKSK